MYLLFDIGGTKMRIAASDGETIGEPIIIPTPQDFNQAMELFKETVADLTHGEEIEKAAGGVRALALDKKTLADRIHTPLWVGEPLYERVKEIINGAPLLLENDTVLAGLGEATAGAGVGKKIVAYMTISTGVGGVKIVDGRIDANALGFEPSYQIIDSEKVLGDYISGKAIEDLYGKKGEDIKDPQFWDGIARYLAIALNNAIVMWSPEIIVLGGSLMKSIPLDRVKAYLDKFLTIFPKLPEIVTSNLGESSGLYGALCFAKQKESSG